MFSRTIVLLSIAVYFSSCGSKVEESGDESSASDSVVTISEEQFAKMQMKTGLPTKKIFSSTIKANGMIDVPPESKMAISSVYGGYVSNLVSLIGDKVTRGQTLFTLENPAFLDLQRDFLTAEGQLSYLQDEYERQSELSKENIASKKTFLKAEAEYKSVLAQRNALEAQLREIGFSIDALRQGKLSASVAVRAPITGFIQEVKAYNGQSVQPGTELLTLLDTRHVHVELSVFEADLPRISMGQDIHFFKPGSEGRTFKAKVFQYGKAVNEENRSTKIHGHFLNEEEGKYFSPGMYVEAEIITGLDSLLALPSTAIVKSESVSYILKRLPGDNGYIFSKIPVTTGRTQNGYTEILGSEVIDPKSEYLLKGGFQL